jgi:hypothetical protein
VRVYVVFVVGVTDCEPVVVFVPVHPPLAVQEVASVVDQFNTVDVPWVTEVGNAVRVRVGVGVVIVVTVTLCEAVPFAPVQVRVYVVVVSGETDCVPAVAFAPVQPPLAVHEVLFVLLQVRVVD